MIAPRWIAGLVGGPYDGLEEEVIAVPEWVAVRRRTRKEQRDGRAALSMIGNPDRTPEGYHLYRLEGFTDERATYIYGELLPAGPDDRIRTNVGARELVNA